MTGILGMMLGSAGLGGSVGTPDLNPNQTNPGGTSSAVLSLTSAGAYSATNDLTGDYCTPTSLASQLEARLTKVSGTGNPTGAAMATWLSLGTTRSWTVSATVGNYVTCDCTLQIREAATGLVRDTSTVTFVADSA